MSANDLRAIETVLAADAFGRPLSILDETTSTNDVARALGEGGAPHGATVVADRQLAGRGSHGRAWHSPPGVNLHVSIVLRPQLEPRRVPLVSLALGLAVADTVQSLSGGTALVKWPNDVWIDREKVAGILVESSSVGAAGSGPRYLVSGIGLAVNAIDQPDELVGIATSMARATGRTFDRALALLRLLDHVHRRVEALERGADVAAALAGRAALIGERALLDDEPCVVDGIEPDGALRILTAAGIERRVSGRLRPADQQR